MTKIKFCYFYFFFQEQRNCISDEHTKLKTRMYVGKLYRYSKVISGKRRNLDPKWAQRTETTGMLWAQDYQGRN